MLQVNVNQKSARMDQKSVPDTFVESHYEAADRQMDLLISQLSLVSNWGERQRAARKLGYLGRAEAVAPLLTALPADPFWMVRCAIIQALEKIGDARAIPTLRRVEQEDAFLTVRHHAAKAIVTLTGRAA